MILTLGHGETIVNEIAVNVGATSCPCESTISPVRKTAVENLLARQKNFVQQESSTNRTKASLESESL